MEKVSKGKVSESKGEGSYQLVGWVERSETQQVSELLGERGKLRGTSFEMRVVGGVLTLKKELLDISG